MFNAPSFPFMTWLKDRKSRCWRSCVFVWGIFSTKLLPGFQRIKVPETLPLYSAGPAWYPINYSDQLPAGRIARKHYDGWVHYIVERYRAIFYDTLSRDDGKRIIKKRTHFSSLSSACWKGREGFISSPEHISASATTNSPAIAAICLMSPWLERVCWQSLVREVTNTRIR